MRILIYIALIILGIPLLFGAFLVIAFWDERVHAKEITKLVGLSHLRLRDDYYCYEGKCFGTFEISNNHEIDFFITRNIAERVIEQSESLGKNWSLAKHLCNKITFREEKEVCQIGGKIISHNELIKEQKAVIN